MDGTYICSQIINGRLPFVQLVGGAEAADGSAAAVQHVIYFNKDPFDIWEGGSEYSHKTYK